MTYDEFIQSILDARGRFGIPAGEYKERHHILPRCIGGTNNKENLIDLYANEHFTAHKLLAEENPDNIKLVRAFTMMVPDKYNRRNITFTAEDYESLRRAYSEAMSSANPMTNPEVRKKISDKLKGRPQSEEMKNNLKAYYQTHDHPNKGKKLSIEDKQKISIDTKRGMADWHARLTEAEYQAHYANISNKLTGKAKPTGFAEHLSEIRQGEGNPMFGKKHKARKKIRCIETGIIYDCAKDACIQLGLDISKERYIRKYCNGIIKKPQFGYTWEFVE